MACLIVNADDFGLTPGVNRAICELNRAGLVTSATLMARGAAADEAIELARSQPSLAVGCHVVLADGEPMLPPEQIPSLVDPHTGRFYPTVSAFLKRLLTGRIDPAEIEAETGAQIAYLQGRGVRLTHVDSHKHLHMFRAALHPVLRAARRAGVAKVRNPFEPLWSLGATPGAPALRRAQVRVLRRLEPAFQRVVRGAGFATTDGALGVLATGTLDTGAISALTGNLPSGCWELVTHPGYNDADLAKAHTRLLVSREIEREALLSLTKEGVRLVSFAECVQSESGRTGI